MNGKNLKEEGTGLFLAGSYKFRAEHPRFLENGNPWMWGGFRGPGHGVPFYDENRGQYFFVHHVRDGAEIYRRMEEDGRASYQVHHMMIRPMYFVDEWPVFGPEPYEGEIREIPTAEAPNGYWEVICFGKEYQEQYESEMILVEWPVFGPEPYEGEIREIPTAEAPNGYWEVICFGKEYQEQYESEMILVKDFHQHFENCIVYECRDFENEKNSIVMSGIDKSGLAYWGKFMYS